MVERRQIVELARSSGGIAGVLVTLVRAEGSSYRRPGARLLTGAAANAPGNVATYAGTISGGCLEAEVVKKAVWKVRAGAVVDRYSTLFDDTAEIPYGLGCGGTIDLLLEPAGTPEFHALIDAFEASLSGERFTVLTWLPAAGRVLQRAVISSSGEPVFRSPGLDTAKIDAALLAQNPDDPDIYIEQLSPPQRLLILGAGDDAKPVVSMAALLGWSVTVADGRPQLARAERFPAAEQVLVATASELHALRISADDAVVLMTHSYEQDRDWLAAVLPLAPRYLGVLGARHRSSLLVSEAAAMIALPVAECCARIYAPVGLDLGGDGPEAIALAIIAEAQARSTGRLPSSRRLSAQDVAEQIEQGGASRYLQAQCALDLAPGELEWGER
ncbi:MAG TPA: XdhC family protein [Granulicella sp.]|jgi:xanthine dehydrogenase accessory factor|nr:XdhC family protein [Granulicella sp.]